MKLFFDTPTLVNDSRDCTVHRRTLAGRTTFYYCCF